MAGLRGEFNAGDLVKVIDDKTGVRLALGIALQSRGRTGLATFQVLDSTRKWAETYNLNYVTVDVIAQNVRDL